MILGLDMVEKSHDVVFVFQFYRILQNLQNSLISIFIKPFENSSRISILNSFGISSFFQFFVQRLSRSLRSQLLRAMIAQSISSIGTKNLSNFKTDTGSCYHLCVLDHSMVSPHNLRSSNSFKRSLFSIPAN